MIKRILRLLILLICLLVVGVPPMYGATEKEVIELFTESQQLCLATLRKCEFRIITVDLPLAYTQGTAITVGSGVYTRLTKDELRGVIYHETAHAILNHSNRTKDYINSFRAKNGREITPAEAQNYKYKMEDDADALAVAMLVWTKHPVLLDEALIKITGPYKATQASWTHPSVQYRVNRIRSIEKKLRGF